jgi:nucleotide-binding universal stress UspA family protein
MFKKILVPLDIDYPEIAAGVYQKARAIAKLSDAAIRLVTVMPGFTMPMVASLVPEDARKEVARRVKTAVEQFIVDYCDPDVTYGLKTGKNWEEIIAEADRWQADLIIVYHNRHREVNDLFSRSCSQRVADHAGCSVLRLRNVQPKSEGA